MHRVHRHCKLHILLSLLDFLLPTEIFAFVLFTYMKEVQCEFKGSILRFFRSNYAPDNVPLELQCSPLFYLYLCFLLTLLAGYFPNFLHWTQAAQAHNTRSYIVFFFLLLFERSAKRDMEHIVTWSIYYIT